MKYTITIVLVILVVIMGDSCKKGPTETLDKLILSTMIKNKSKNLNSYTSAKINSISPKYDIIKSNNKSYKKYTGYTVSYNYEVKDSVFKNFEWIHYDDFQFSESKPFLDSTMKVIFKLIIKYDSLKPSRAQIDFDQTFLVDK